MTNHHEDAEQTALFKWAGYFPELKWMHASANGGNRNVREASRLKAQGVKPGVPDVCLPIARKPYHGLYIEMKRRKQDGRSTVSQKQKDFKTDISNNGYLCVTCYGADEAIQVIKDYLALPPYEK